MNPLNTTEISTMASGLVSQMDGNIFCLDAEGVIRYANPSACNDLGYKLDHLLTKTLFEHSPGLRKSQWKDHYEKTITDGSCQFISYHKNTYGQVYPVQTTSTLLDKESDYICCMVRSLKEARHYSDLLDQIAAANGLGGFEIDLNSGYLLTTDSLLQIMQIRDPEEIRFENVQKKMSPNSSERYRIKLAEERAGGSPLSGVFEFITPLGNSQWFELTHLPSRDSSDSNLIRGYFKLLEDDTENDRFDLEECQRRHIRRVLQRTNGRVSGKKGAAILLNINPKTLFARMRKMGIERNDFDDHL